MKNSNTSLDLEFEMRPDYLYARIGTTKINRETALDHFAEIAVMVGPLHHRRRILIERITHAKQDDECLMEVLTNYIRLSHGLKVAFFNARLTDGEALNDNSTNKDAAGAEFKYFNDQAAAESWLLKPRILKDSF